MSLIETKEPTSEAQMRASVKALRAKFDSHREPLPRHQRIFPSTPLCPKIEPKPINLGTRLDPRLTFDTFVVARPNALAHAACHQVATARPGDPTMFNPLYVHSDIGLGKTHLLQAIAHRFNAAGDRKALYLTADGFICRFVGTKQANPPGGLAREVDLLLLDDLTFLKGKQNGAELAHVLNMLLDGGKQVVVAAGCPPAELDGLDARVRSRLAGGLAVEIGLMDEATRFEVMSRRISAAREMHPGFDVAHPVLSYVSGSLARNGRDIEGACNRLLAHSKLTGQPVTMEFVERELRDMVRPDQRRIKIEEIQMAVARHYNVSRSDMLSARRTANVVRPRQIAMYLAKVMTLRSLPEIGRRFGGRDHTTILHAVRKIENLAGRDQTVRDKIDAIKALIQAGAH